MYMKKLTVGTSSTKITKEKKLSKSNENKFEESLCDAKISNIRNNIIEIIEKGQREVAIYYSDSYKDLIKTVYIGKETYEIYKVNREAIWEKCSLLDLANDIGAFLKENLYEAKEEAKKREDTKLVYLNDKYVYKCGQENYQKSIARLSLPLLKEQDFDKK